MNRTRKIIFIMIAVSLMTLSFYAQGQAWEKWTQDDPITDEWNTFDLLAARPIGIAAGIVGTGIFIVSLPFTIPTGSVDKAAHIFIERPFKFSFVREFPDEHM